MALGFGINADIHTATPQGLLSSLREETATDHRRLDRALSVEDIVATRDAYFRYLKGFHRALILCLSEFNWPLLDAQGLPDLKRRVDRYLALESDIGSVIDCVEDLYPATGGHCLSYAGQLGSLYVVEGTIHGGLIIQAALAKSLPDVARNHAAFLCGFGGESVELWGRFVHWLESQRLGGDGRSEAIVAAKGVFGRFEKYLGQTERQLPRPE